MRDEFQVGQLRLHGGPACRVHVAGIGGIAAVDEMTIPESLPRKLQLFRRLRWIEPEQFCVYDGGVLHIVAPAVDGGADEPGHYIGMLSEKTA